MKWKQELFRLLRQHRQTAPIFFAYAYHQLLNAASFFKATTISLLEYELEDELLIRTQLHETNFLLVMGRFGP
jgi:hypothetical protein